jgi:hypothetical protein
VHGPGIRGNSQLASIPADARAVDVLVLAAVEQVGGVVDEHDEVIDRVLKRGKRDLLVRVDARLDADSKLRELSGSSDGLPPKPNRSVAEGARNAVPADSVNSVPGRDR